MYILGINFSHHGSICLLKDGEVVLFLEEERLSHNKYSSINDYSYKVLHKIKDYTDKIDYVCLSADCAYLNEVESTFNYNENKLKNIFNILVTRSNIYHSTTYIQKCSVIWEIISTFCTNKTKVYLEMVSHHKVHAAQSFYNSGFKEALCIVIDGQGSRKNDDYSNKLLFERESIYYFNYENNGNQLYCNYDSEGNGIGSAYSRVTRDIGFTGGFEEGKTMGLSSYKPHNMEDPTMMVNVAKANAVQLGTQEEALKLILYSLTLSDSKNICISGGYGLNCVSNYYIRRNLPPDINLYCEPVANDAGQSIGIAKFIHHYLTGDKTIRPQKSIYYGPTPEYWNDTLAKTPLKPN